MEVLLLLVTLIILLFGFVLLFGAPYLPTLTPQVKTALAMADLRKGQHLLELGCGDGKILIAAAQQGIRVTGYELNPILVLICKLRTRRYKKLVTVVWGNFWNIKLPESDAIFVFLLPKFMDRLDKKIVQESSAHVKLVSFAFEIPYKRVVSTRDGVFLYQY